MIPAVWKGHFLSSHMIQSPGYTDLMSQRSSSGHLCLNQVSPQVATGSTNVSPAFLSCVLPAPSSSVVGLLLAQMCLATCSRWTFHVLQLEGRLILKWQNWQLGIKLILWSFAPVIKALSWLCKRYISFFFFSFHIPADPLKFNQSHFTAWLGPSDGFWPGVCCGTGQSGTRVEQPRWSRSTRESMMYWSSAFNQHLHHRQL